MGQTIKTSKINGNLFIVPILVAGFLIVIFFKNSLIQHIRSERSQTKAKAHAVMLNQLRPDEGYLKDLIQSQGHDQNVVRAYANYYEKVTEYIPDRADAYGILGFCYFNLGEPKKAVKAYARAIQLNPDFFWFYYNLSLIHFKEGQYQEAAGLLEKALHLNPSNTLKFILNSREVYLPLLIEQKINSPSALEKQLRNGYENTKKLLRSSLLKLEGTVPMPQTSLELEVF